MINPAGGSANKYTPAKSREIKTFKNFFNGDRLVTNVPYMVQVNDTPYKKERVTGTYIPHEVFRELSNIFWYMKEHDLNEMDYQAFVLKKHDEKKGTGNGHHTNKEYLNKKQLKPDLKTIPKEDQDKVTAYVLEEWIEPYYELKRQVDLNGNNTKELEQQVEYFHGKLSLLPESHEEIIYTKYLDIDEAKSYPLDDFVYESLNINRTYYYKWKKEALYWLGLSLLEDEKKETIQ